MKKWRVLLLTFFCSLGAFGTYGQEARTVSFDSDWRFKKDSLPGAECPTYRDTGWRKLDLPHDWSIEDLPNQQKGQVQGPFSKSVVSGRDGGFLVGGTAWYRKHFTRSKASSAKKIYIQFDGVYMNADVWINGHHLGNHPNGYTSFSYELTPYLHSAGQDNVIAVEVKNEGVNSRWYSGSGIYRHVWLTTVNPLHIGQWGTYITTPSVTEQAATVSVEATIQTPSGNGSFTVQTQLYAPTGKLAGTDKKLISAHKDSVYHSSQTISVANPALWSLEQPGLYRANVQLVQNGNVVDETTTTFGIRSIHVDAKTGFSLNGKPIKLRGAVFTMIMGPWGQPPLTGPRCVKSNYSSNRGTMPCA